jgi:hypothetical protein
LTVVIANQTRPRPNRPFIEVQATNIDLDGFPEDVLDLNPGGASYTAKVISQARVTFALRVYTADRTAMTKLSNILLKLDGVEVGNIIDASLVLETEFEGRAVADLTQYVCLETPASNVDTIASAYGFLDDEPFDTL